MERDLDIEDFRDPDFNGPSDLASLMQYYLDMSDEEFSKQCQKIHDHNFCITMATKIREPLNTGNNHVRR